VQEWKVRQLAYWANRFPLGMPEAKSSRRASGKERPVAGSLYDGLSEAQFAVCNFISEAIHRPISSKSAMKNRRS